MYLSDSMACDHIYFTHVAYYGLWSYRIDKYLQVIQLCVGGNIVVLKWKVHLKNEVMFVYILGDHMIMIDWNHLNGIVHAYVYMYNKGLIV